MNTQIERQLRAETTLCSTISELIKDHGYSVYDVRDVVSEFAGEIFRQTHPREDGVGTAWTSDRPLRPGGTVWHDPTAPWRG